MADINVKEVITDENEKHGRKINPVPPPETNIGLDTEDAFWEAMLNAADASAIDIGVINSFSQISQHRETLYQVLDTMGEDSTIAAMLETYAEDATETNDAGEIVWVESSDSKVGEYINFLLDSLNIDKNIYKWMYSFIKYGDVYLRLYRESDFQDGLLDKKQKTDLNEQFTNLNEKEVQDKKEKLEEDAKFVVYSKKDRFVNYIEMVPNPAEMFELTKFGKSYSYIKTNNLSMAPQTERNLLSYHTYRFRKKDVEIYNAVTFVHGSLQDDTPRIPEQVEMFLSDDFESESNLYNVRRGQSILYDSYKIWRNVSLLENALLLNRLTKSALLRIVELEVGDMPKERVGPALQRVKKLIEQKTSIDTGNRMGEYTNPGAMENTVYIPTNNGKGAINTQQIGGDVNVRDIADMEYFKNKLFSSMKIPKQFMGETDDATGFNGGTSLSIISSRYAKTVKRIQAAMVQALTDAINILLLDRGLDNYVNKFSLRMQAPITQEELDKRDNTSSLIGITDDVLRIVGEIEDPVIKMKIAKSLLSNSITNQEVIKLIQDYIEDLEQKMEDTPTEGEGEDDFDFDMGSIDGSGGDSTGGGTGDFDMDEFSGEVNDSFDDAGMDLSGNDLPMPSDLGAGDLTEV